MRRNQAIVDRSEVTEILARVKVAGVGYTLLMFSDMNAVWHQDTQIVKLKEQLNNEWKNVQSVVYEQVSPEKERLEQELEVQTLKHQDSLKRLHEIVEKQNESNQKTQQEMKETEKQSALEREAKEAKMA